MAKKLPGWCKSAKKALIDQDMSVTELADALNMSQTYVSTVINGGRYSVTTVKKISDYLHIPDATENTAFPS